MSSPEASVGRAGAAARRRRRAGREGPRVGAFFDFDGTLIDGYSLPRVRPAPPAVGRTSPRSTWAGCCCSACAASPPRRTSSGSSCSACAPGRAAARTSSPSWASGCSCRASPGSLYPEAWRLVEAHRRAGHTVVLASSATRFQVEPAARAMGVEHVLVTPVEIENGIAHRAPRRPAAVAGAARPTAVRAFAAASTASTSRRATPTPTARGRAVPVDGRARAGAQPRAGAGDRRGREGLAGRALPPPRAGPGCGRSPAPRRARPGCSAGSARAWRWGR